MKLLTYPKTKYNINLVVSNKCSQGLAQLVSMWPSRGVGLLSFLCSLKL